MRAVLMAMTCIFSTPVLAAPVAGEKPIAVDKAVGNAVTQPLSDANLKKREIPAELIAIRNNPYALDGIRTCNQVIAAVMTMEAALGTDFDRVAPEDRGKTERSAARMAGGVIGGLIPFRGVVRELSGANKADEEYRQAIFAGGVRRGFLKGYGVARRCAPPGRPLTDRENAREAATTMAQDAAGRMSKR